MKRILGLDLGITSIGFAYVLEAENANENSSIEKIGVRVNPLTTDEQTNFEKGKPLTTNADRTLKRGARRNLDRFQQRRGKLIEVLKSANIIVDDSVLTEQGNFSTHETWKLRSKAAIDKIEKHELARVLLSINKKRGYKSSRRAKNEEEGQVIDGMAIAKRMYDEGLTPGQLAFRLLGEGRRVIPDFYRSDLLAEFDTVWQFQKQFYPDILTDEFYIELQGKGQRATSSAFWGKYKFNTAENKGKRDEKRVQAYKWRSEAIHKQLEKEEVAYVITEINNDLSKSSGYLGAISDRSKELYFNRETVGQNLYKQLQQNPHARLKNQVFYRQDYMDEFETIWEIQSKYHPELTLKLKDEVRDIVIFYQRKLKSQKGLISFCELESKEVEIYKEGKQVKKRIGSRVAPKSSPLFQEFKIWQVLGNVRFKNKVTKQILPLDNESKRKLFEELNIKGNLTANAVIQLVGLKSKDWEVNFKTFEGNRTNQLLYEAYLKIIELEGYNVKELLGSNDNKDEVVLADIGASANEVRDTVSSIFKVLEIDSRILDFEAELDGKDFEKQPSYQLWHLLYSAEDDTNKLSEEDALIYGNENVGLKKQLCKKFGFQPNHAKILAGVIFPDDFGSLSTRAMRKIYPFLKEREYSEACVHAGYRHSKSSLTKEELENRQLKPKLELLKKNSLRNPVVEKILNQMINVVNTLVDSENQKLKEQGLQEVFQFDEIRIELARELKKNAAERADMTSYINTAKIRHDKITKILQDEFGILYPTKNDIVRYKLYEELKNVGYKDLYTDTYIPKDKLFSKEVDIEHIIPQSKAFDDSFSNKTLAYRKDNLDKGNQTAMDYIESQFGSEKLNEFVERITYLYQTSQKNKDKPEEGISKAKWQKLQKREAEIGDGFAERDLRDSQYIAKKAKELLFEITRSVVSTSGSITDRLREDWGLINVMKELNLPKYRALGLTKHQERKNGNTVEVISDWTKRNDHRHHAMDALTVAFTKHNHIQYLNYLSARKDENHKLHAVIVAIEEKETSVMVDENGNRKRIFRQPIPNFRQIAKEHLEGVLISHKAKNKVVTRNRNKIAGKEIAQETLTPRGQLHKETVYGNIKVPVVELQKINAKFGLEMANCVSNPLYKAALIQRLEENNNDSTKAFGGKNALSKNSIYTDIAKTKKIPERVKVMYFEEDFTIRKDITPDLKIDKIVDEGVKRILSQRLNLYKGNAKEAFSNLDKNPIWLNKEKGISIKRVTISGVKNAEPLHYKRDHFGNEILDMNGNRIPSDFVSTGNNHHVAIYKDEAGNLQEKVVSFFEAVERVNQNLPIIDKSYNQHIGWAFLFSMKQNEYFVFPNEKTGFDPNAIDLLDPSNKNLISPNLFRVQKFTTKDYFFRHHFETHVEDNAKLKGVTWKRFGPTGMNNVVKVRLDHIGNIVRMGEY